MNKYLILIAGSPATGKSYLTNEIKKKIPDLFMITPDEIKETVADAVGFSDLEEKKELEKDVWKFYYQILKIYMRMGKRFILSEYPFSDKQKDGLTALSKKYHYHVLTIRLVADFNQLWRRRKIRDVAPDRHLSHIMTSYHFGDKLSDRTLANNLINKEDFKKIIEERQYNSFVIGKLYEFDVTDFTKVDYSGLLNELSEINES